jgi:hypothetical protein
VQRQPTGGASIYFYFGPAGVAMLIRELLKKGLKLEKLASRRKAS